MAETKRARLEILRGQLENERTSFMSHWRDLSDYILPRRARFYTSDVNKGDRRNRNIVDSTATLAARTLRSGMMSGITSPARPWFRLTTPDPGFNEYEPVKQWLYQSSDIMRSIYLKSNIYNTFPIVYGDVGTFATAPFSVEEDFSRVLRTQSFPVGSYMIAKDFRGRVNVFFREFRMTVRQLVEQFGRKEDTTGKADWSNFSPQIKSMWERGQGESWIDVCHVIQPNQDWDENKVESKFKKFTSIYYEKGYSAGSDGSYLSPGIDDRFLSEKGYDFFPILCPRWEVTGEDVYGTDCPGMTALGDIKQLQLGEKRGMQAIEKMVNPPLQGPSSLRSQKVSILPGDINYHDDVSSGGLRPLFEMNPRIVELESKQVQCRNRIQRAYYEDLFLMLANLDRREITAREISERHEEKLLALGPVLEQLNSDALDPLIDITFEICLRQGKLPKPPKELQGMDLKVEYISNMAQAQKLVGLSGIERFTGYFSSIAEANPSVLDKVNADQLIDVYADMASVPPGVVVSDEEVAAIRAQRAQQQQRAANMELMKTGASAARDLSQSNMEGDTALKRLVGG